MTEKSSLTTLQSFLIDQIDQMTQRFMMGESSRTVPIVPATETDLVRQIAARYGASLLHRQGMVRCRHREEIEYRPPPSLTRHPLRPGAWRMGRSPGGY